MSNSNYKSDYLAVAATKPILYGGVPFNYMILNLSLSAAPGLLLVFFGVEPIFILVTWAALFCFLHKIGVYYTKRDAEFMSICLKNTSLISRSRGATYWQGYNSYRI